MDGKEKSAIEKVMMANAMSMLIAASVKTWR
jgi:hypothetical protein